jgi:RHS repeat-associated protein
MVEQNRSSVYTGIVYGPGGHKFALMSGQTLQKAFVPLTGGSMAVYNSSGLAYYRHSDWLGSSRFASTPARTMYADGAYAPFGEAYAQSGTADLSYTGMNQDTAANLYDFAAREYGIQGRWPSPDPAGISAASLKDPQTWNRYAYVRNSPLHAVDPQGLMVVMGGTIGGGGNLMSLFMGALLAFDGPPTLGGIDSSEFNFMDGDPTNLPPAVQDLIAGAATNGQSGGDGSTNSGECLAPSCNENSNGNGYCFNGSGNPTACGTPESPNENATCLSSTNAPCDSSDDSFAWLGQLGNLDTNITMLYGASIMGGVVWGLSTPVAAAMEANVPGSVAFISDVVSAASVPIYTPGTAGAIGLCISVCGNEPNGSAP